MRKVHRRPKLVPQRNQIEPSQEEYGDEHQISQVSMHFEGESQPLLSQLTDTMMSHLDAEVTSVSTD